MTGNCVRDGRARRLYAKIKCASNDVAEQKARVTYDNLLRLIDDPDVCEPIRFLREREVVHYQRFGEAIQTKLSGFS